MDKDKIQLVGILPIVAGLALSSIGGYKVATNLPISVEQRTKAVEKRLEGKRDFAGNPMNRSILGTFDVMNAKTEAQWENRKRAAKRKDAMPLFIPGVLLLIAGAVVCAKK